MQIFFPNASIKYPPANGGDVHRYQLIKNLTELGHEVVTLKPDENPHTLTRPKRPIQIVRALRAADVLYCRLEEKPNAATALTSGAKRWLIPKRTAVVWELNISLAGSSTLESRPDHVIRRHLASLRRQAKRVDAVIGVARGLATQAQELLGARHTHVIQNASDPEMFRRDVEVSHADDRCDDQLQVVTIGSNPNSYHDVEIIQSLGRRIDERKLPLFVHVFGRSRELFGANVPKSIRLCGPISYLDMPSYLAAMDVGLALYNIPLDLGSPLKLFDYLASGCVPICSEGQSVHEVLDNTDAGLIGSWKAETLCQILMELHKDRGRLQAMRQNGRRLIENEYNWRRVTERTVAVLEEAIRRRAGSGQGT